MKSSKKKATNPQNFKNQNSKAVWLLFGSYIISNTKAVK